MGSLLVVFLFLLFLCFAVIFVVSIFRKKNVKKAGVLALCTLVLFCISVVAVGNHQRDQKAKNAYVNKVTKHNVSFKKIKVLSAAQSIDDQKQQYFLVRYKGKLYMINYTGEDGQSAVEDSLISTKGENLGTGTVTSSQVKMGINSEYKNKKAVIVASKKIKVNKAY